MIRINNYVSFHTHSDLSLLDSCTKFTDYVDKAVELGQKAICISEHGNLYNWVAKKMYCDKNGIKYLHGVECYLTETHKEKVRDNFHTILIAKNFSGVLELNQLISDSNEESHFYYKNRLSFDEFLQISKNIIKISACLASPLNKLNLTNPYYSKLAKHYDYYEIQPHNHIDQIRYNQHLCQLAEEHKKPLIAGTDAHNLNKYKGECRDILLAAKHIEYSDEDAFDLTYKSCEELVNAFKNQDAIPEKYYIQAIENTNVMSDSVEDFKLDTSFKYPILYGDKDKDKEVFMQTIQKKFKQKIDEGVIPKEQIQAFEESIKEECRVFDKIEMSGFMLSMSEFVTWCKENDIPVGFNRGSCGGSRVAYITDITDLNPETWHTVFSRFCNENRKEIGDIDIDVNPNDRDKVYNYIINRFRQIYATFILAVGTISDKGTIDEIGRALSIRWAKENNKKPDDSPYSIKQMAKIKNEYASNPEETKQKYPDVFYYFDGLINTAISQSMHPAGIVVSPITLPDNYGTFINDNKVILQIDMECVHEVSLVKYDILGLKNIGIIKDAYKLIGKPYPKSHEINWNDEKVWADMIKSPCGIFQMEGDYAFMMLRQYVPKSIFDMSLVTAAIRPSGASYRDRLMNHLPNKNPSSIIDELLKDNNGYLIYQEDTIKFLTDICGLSGSDADNVRRAIGRKDEERLKTALPQILDGYCNKSPQPREIAEKEAKAFLQIIEDSASYQFGKNHSIGYCMIGYLCAYLRYYYPYEFITSYLNNASNEDDVKNGSELAQEYNIKIVAPKYGLSKDKYVFDKEKKVIAKGINSIKYLNAKVASELFELSQRNKFTSFMDLLMAISKETSTDSRQLDILVKIDYFSDFGNSKELLCLIRAFDLLKQGTAKQLVKDKVSAEMKDIVSPYLNGNKKDGKPAKSYSIIDMQGLLSVLEKHILSKNIPDFDYKNKIQNQLELLGYVDLITNIPDDRRKLLITDIFPLKSKGEGNENIWAYVVFTRSLGTGKSSRLTIRYQLYDRVPIKKFDIIYATTVDKDKRGYWYLLDYQIISQ